MERNLSLIREILLRIEEMQSRNERVDLGIEGYPEKTVVYNLDLAIKAGLVEEEVDWKLNNDDYYFFDVETLTWEGHDFLDSVRQDAVWKTTQDRVERAGHKIAQVSLGVIKEVAVSVIRNQLGLPS